MACVTNHAIIGIVMCFLLCGSALRVFDDCDDDTSCPVGSSCIWRGCDGKKCICQGETLPAQELTQCVPGVKLGGSCKRGDVCHGQPFSECIDSSCVCLDGYKLSSDGTFCVPRSQGNSTGAEYGQTCRTNSVVCVYDLICDAGICTCPKGNRMATKDEMFAKPFDYRLCVPESFVVGKPVNVNGPECQKPGLPSTPTTPTTVSTTPTTTTVATTPSTTTRPTSTSTHSTTSTTKTSTKSPTTSSTTPKTSTTTTTTTTPTTTTHTTKPATTTKETTPTPKTSQPTTASTTASTLTTSTTATTTTSTTTKPTTPTTSSTASSTTFSTTTPTTPTPQTTTVAVTSTPYMKTSAISGSVSSKSTTSVTEPATSKSTPTTSSKQPVTTTPVSNTPSSSPTSVTTTVSPTTSTKTSEPIKTSPFSTPTTVSVNVSTTSSVKPTVGLGDPCYNKACPDNSECVQDGCNVVRCRCVLGYANSPDQKSCWKLATLGELCGKQKICQGANTICSDRGICECESGFERSDSGRWCRLKSSWFIQFPVIGEECSDGFSSQCYMYFEQECVQGKCRCKDGFREVATITDQNAVYPDTVQCRNASFDAGERETMLCSNQSKEKRDYDVYSKAKSKIHRIQGAIIGGSVGFVALLGIVIGILVLIRWKRKGRQQAIRDTSSMASTDATSRYSFKIPRPFTHFVGSKEFDSTQIAYPNTVFDRDDRVERTQGTSEPKPDVVNVGTLLRQSQNLT